MLVSISRSLRRVVIAASALVTVGALSACVPYPAHYDQRGGYYGGRQGGQHYQQGYNQGNYYRYGYPTQQPGYYQPGYGG